MTYHSNFVRDNDFGKVAEEKVFELLATSNKVARIIDCSNDKYYQAKDIDILVEMMDGRVVKYEVKHDRQMDDTGNITYEVVDGKNKGCLERSEADYVIVLSKQKRLCIDLKKWQELIGKTYPKLHLMGDNACGYLFKINDLINQKIAKEF